MEQGIFNRLLNSRNRLRLPADLLPCDRGNLIKQVGLGLPVFQFLDCHVEARLDTHLIPGLQVYADKIARSLEDEYLPSHFLLETKPPICQCFRHFQHGPVTVITQYPDHRIGFIDQNLGADL